ncbi:MAG: hypothetical protein VCD00_09375 [Candidatus Hydrogenedentota bacterium]
MRRLKTVAGWIWRVLLGAFMVQSPLFAVLAVGWVYRAMQRAALKSWWRMSDEPQAGGTFREATEEQDSFRGHAYLPNWITAQEPIAAWKARQASSSGFWAIMKNTVFATFGSLGRNFKIGLQGLFNIAVLTILPAMLWQFGWYSGWDNSFNKGYEQHDIGILISLMGIAIFIAVMFYLPMAQARQAITGEWRSFYQFRIVWAIVRTRSISCLILAALYGLVSLPVTFFKMLPLFLENINPAILEMSDPELLEYMNGYFFRAGIVFFLGYWLLHAVAARIYAKGLIEAVAREKVSIDDLSTWELNALVRLSLVRNDAGNQRHIVIRIVDTVTKPARKIGIVTATILLWFGFVAQIYVSEFLVYHPKRGMLNQPLIQLPWYNYTPKHLNTSKEPTDSHLKLRSI